MPSGGIRLNFQPLALWGPFVYQSFQLRLEALEADDLPEADELLEADMLWAGLLAHIPE